jgi:hypothetical protein
MYIVFDMIEDRVAGALGDEASSTEPESAALLTARAEFGSSLGNPTARITKDVYQGCR